MKKFLKVLASAALCLAIPIQTTASDGLHGIYSDNVFEAQATAYCGCCNCSEGWGTMTATGSTAQEGRTIAVDPHVIPLGSTVLVYIDHELYGIFQAEDTGGVIKGNMIDIYFEEHESCQKFGRQTVTVEVVNGKG